LAEVVPGRVAPWDPGPVLGASSSSSSGSGLQLRFLDSAPGSWLGSGQFLPQFQLPARFRAWPGPGQLLARTLLAGFGLPPAPRGRAAL